MKSIEEISRMDLSQLGDEEPLTEETLDQEEGGNSESSQGEVPEGDVESGDGEDQAGHADKSEDDQEKMAEPVGEHYYIDARVGKEELATFIRRHFLTAPSQLLLSAFGVFLLVYSLFFSHKNLLVAIIYFAAIVVIYPILQYNKVMKTNLNNPVYQDVLHYMADEWGFHLETAGKAVDVPWNQFSKRKDFKNIHVLYTGRSSAFILPKKAMEDSEGEVIAFIDRMMGK